MLQRYYVLRYYSLEIQFDTHNLLTFYQSNRKLQVYHMSTKTKFNLIYCNHVFHSHSTYKWVCVVCVCIFGISFRYGIKRIDSKLIYVCLINDYSLIADLHIFVCGRAEWASISLKCTKVKLIILNNLAFYTLLHIKTEPKWYEVNFYYLCLWTSSSAGGSILGNRIHNYICIPESFNTNISYQFFYIQNNVCEFHKTHTNWNDYFVPKNW